MLAAGASRRMGGEDKLLRPVDGEPLLRRAAKAAAGSKASAVRVILPPAAEARRAALSGLDVALTDAPQAARGMAASLHAGLLATAPDTAAIIIALADMPEITAEHFNRVIAAFDPREAREICRATSADGVPGHPVLFGARFFESLKGLRADEGARRVLEDNREFVTLVPAPGQGAVVDLDTPAAWAAWEAAQPNQPG
nr:nucleotidyltransferase family protein [Poseidonocella sedimentorum]